MSAAPDYGQGSWLDAERVASAEAAREVLRDALAEVWSGADFTDTDAVIDQLDDRGYRVVRKWKIEDLL